MDSPDGVLRLLGFPPLKLSPHLEGVARMIRPGLSVLLERRLPELRSLRLGLVAHQASVTPNLHLAVEALREAGCRLVRLFSLGHGLWSAAPDGILVSSD